VCRGIEQNAGQLDLASLAQFKGIGPWTVGMVAMRGHGDPDIFPMGDLGLVKAYADIAGNESLDKTCTDQWRPWRSYAANLLWRSLSL
jgi:AraC family transcriptional regulator of adaptative response / DNA-3-methyladenine glycosylase II